MAYRRDTKKVHICDLFFQYRAAVMKTWTDFGIVFPKLEGVNNETNMQEARKSVVSLSLLRITGR